MRTILIVDDEYGIAEIVGDILSTQGYSAVCAMNGKLGLATLGQTRPDLILLDVMMPVMTGPELLHAVKSSPDYCDIPVVMMSAVGREALSVDDCSLIAGFLRKPFTFDELMQVLGRVLECRA